MKERQVARCTVCGASATPAHFLPESQDPLCGECFDLQAQLPLPLGEDEKPQEC